MQPFFRHNLNTYKKVKIKIKNIKNQQIKVIIKFFSTFSEKVLQKTYV